MDHHALAVLAEAELWDWPLLYHIQGSGEQGGKYRALTAKLLACCIRESRAFPDSILVERFWHNVKNCHSGFRTNIARIRRLPVSVSREELMKTLFDRIERESVDFTPIVEMGKELFTHLGMAFLNPGGPKSGAGTPYSVSDFISNDTDELLREAARQGFGKRRQCILKALSFKRDGNKCILTESPLKPMDPDGVEPILSHMIPNSVYNKADTLKCIGMLAGTKVQDLVVQHLNGIGNVMNLEWNAQTAYDNIEWAIQADEDHGKVTYTFRKLLRKDSPGPGLVKLKDGDKIRFGQGNAKDIEKLGGGPLPVLCNLQYAVARVLRISGAADVIAQLKDDADDSDIPLYLTSTDFANILTAKLLLNSGHVLY